MNISIQQMRTLVAVIESGSIQSGAKSLNKTHPSVIAALKKMESEIGFSLFDRSGYRLVLTEEGKAFHKSVQRILNNLSELKNQANHLKKGEESELTIVLGDITSISESMILLRKFSKKYPSTQLNFLFENLYGPNERLLDGGADLILHHIDKSDPRYEYQNFGQVQIVPVVAPDFLKFSIHDEIDYLDLEGYTQCIINDTSSKMRNKNYFVLPDSPHINVGDQHTKKEIIMQRMAWGHMPLFLVEDELKRGELVSIQGKYLRGNTIDIVVARLSTQNKAIMAERLWNFFKENHITI